MKPAYNVLPEAMRWQTEKGNDCLSLSRFSPKVSIVLHFVCNSELKNSIIMKLKKHMKSDDADMRDAPPKKEIQGKMIFSLLGLVCLR